MTDKWYVVPLYSTDKTPRSGADVYNRCGELVATFERIEDAERAVGAVNGRDKTEVHCESQPVRINISDY